MAGCPKCGTPKKLQKRSDNWFYCKRHGRVRKVAPPHYQMLTREIEG